jgi:putative transposase
MPRTARLELPGFPTHVVQRGVNRCAIFLDDDDRRHYRHVLGESCARHDVAIHAYALMDNHVHLLLSTPRAGAIAAAMRRSGQMHVQAFNTRHGRTGTLWQGRYKSCLVDSDRYLLVVLRYIELNPVRAALVDLPQAYEWSSARAHLGLAYDPRLRFSSGYLELGTSPSERAEAYRSLLFEELAEQDLLEIRRYIAKERALGCPRFQAFVEETLGRPAKARSGGRPRSERE